MALLKYLTLKRHDTSNTSSESLPDPSGPLTITMPSGSITAANSSVAKVLEQVHDIIPRAPLRKNKLHGDAYRYFLASAQQQYLLHGLLQPHIYRVATLRFRIPSCIAAPPEGFHISLCVIASYNRIELHAHPNIQPRYS